MEQRPDQLVGLGMEKGDGDMSGWSQLGQQGFL
jgi:hypothetical protein